VKNNKKVEQECAGRAANAESTDLFHDRTQILGSIRESYGAGRPVESVMRDCMARMRAGSNPDNGRLLLPDMELGQTIYRKRKCGKVASFFRCLLR
jgi:hypothetical protein